MEQGFLLGKLRSGWWQNLVTFPVPQPSCDLLLVLPQCTHMQPRACEELRVSREDDGVTGSQVYLDPLAPPVLSLIASIPTATSRWSQRVTKGQVLARVLQPQAGSRGTNRGLRLLPLPPPTWCWVSSGPGPSCTQLAEVEARNLRRLGPGAPRRGCECSPGPGDGWPL